VISRFAFHRAQVAAIRCPLINAATPWSVMAAPIFFGTAGPGPVRSYAIVRPRTAALTSVGGACP
jgi:hypothetical protein